MSTKDWENVPWIFHSAGSAIPIIGTSITILGIGLEVKNPTNYWKFCLYDLDPIAQILACKFQLLDHD